MKIDLFVKVEGKYCSDYCPFLNFSECLLFNENLEDKVLPEGFEYQEGVQPTKERCNRCFWLS